MSEDVDGAGRRSPGPRLLVRPLLLFARDARLGVWFHAIRGFLAAVPLNVSFCQKSQTHPLTHQIKGCGTVPNFRQFRPNE